jgi:hypothetical protein
MPLRALFTVAMLSLSLTLLSTTLLAQHASGGGGFSGGGGSHASSGGFSSGSSGSSASSHTSSGSSSGAHSSTTSSPSSRTGSTPPSRVSEPNSGAKSESPSNEKKGFWGFLHKKPEPKSDLVTRTKWPIGCKKGEACHVCSTGGLRNAGSGCVSPVNTCSAGLVWNGFSCGVRSQVNDCGHLADQLAAQQRQMQGQSDPGQSAFYQLLRRQYEACLARSGYHSARYNSPFANFGDPLDTR